MILLGDAEDGSDVEKFYSVAHSKTQEQLGGSHYKLHRVCVGVEGPSGFLCCALTRAYSSVSRRRSLPNIQIPSLRSLLHLIPII